MTALDSAKFRRVLGHFPTGVTVITAKADGGPPVGMAIGSFSSLSLDPPLVLFCPAKSSSSWPQIEAAGTYCVNILAADQEDVCRVFAGKSPDKFEGLGWRPHPVTGDPVLEGVLAWIACRIEAVHEGGDHVIAVGRVVELDVEHEGAPLIFFRGGYGSFEV